jgi:hypothetical protein
MTGSDSDTEDPKQISVAELLARNGTIGAPTVTRRRRRRRGDDSVSVAELTGEIPIIRDDHHQRAARPESAPPAAPASGGVQVAAPPPAPSPAPVAGPATADTPDTAVTAAEHPVESEARVESGARVESETRVEPEVAIEPDAKAAYWSEPEPRWPKSEPIATRRSGPERSEYPRPLRHLDATDYPGDADGQSGAEGMSPDPVGHYTDASVDVMDSEVREAESAVEDSAYVRSYLHGSESGREHALFAGESIADEVARRRPGQATLDEDRIEPEGEPQPGRSHAKMAGLGRGILTVLQSILAVAFGAGLFIAFDQLWRWNSIVALVLSVLVILGLVVGVRVVRKTEDIASTLIAVAVGALITLGPMALLQTG